MDNHNSVVSFKKPECWDSFLCGKLSESESIIVLEQLLNNFEYEKSKVNYEVINHILQKNNLIIPAYGFDFLGQGTSCFSKGSVLSSFRKNDNIMITNLQNEVIIPDFKQYGGEDYTTETQLVVNLKKGEWVIYSFSLDMDIKQIKVDLTPQSLSKLLYINNTLIKENQFYDLNHMKESIYELKILTIEDVEIQDISINASK